MASGNQGIQQLISAEAEAAAIVEEARNYRKKKLKSAEQGAQGEIAQFRSEIQAKFDDDSTSDIGSTLSYQATLDRETKTALEKMTEVHRKKSDEIVDLLVYHATTVSLKVPESIAQCVKATMYLES